MRYIFILVAAMLFAGLDSGWAAEKQAAEMIEGEEQGIKEIDLGDDGASDGVPPATGYGEGDRRIMPTWEDEDQNTGLPDTVESDVKGTVQEQ